MRIVQEVEPNKLQTYTFRTPAVFKQAEISRIKGKLKAKKRYESMADRHLKMQLDYNNQYQIKLGLDIRKLL